MLYKSIVLFWCFSLFALFARCEDSFEVDAECAKNEKCVDDKIYQIMEKIDNEETIPLIGGLEIVKVPSSRDDISTPRDAGLWEWIENYIDSHTIQFSDFAEIEQEVARTKKIKKYLLPILILVMLKVGLVVPTILSAITLIAIKGLFAGVFAIILSGVTALKSLSDGKQDRVTAIVAPIPADILKHHTDYGNRWSRLGQDVPGSVANLVQQPVVPTSNLLTQAYAPDPSLDPYNAYSPYPTIISQN